MKILLSGKSISMISLLLLLSLNVVAGMTILVNAKVVKDQSVYINGSGSIILVWKSSKSQTFNSNGSANFAGLESVTIFPSPGWYIYSVLIDGNPQQIADEDGCSLTYVKPKNTISVTFMENPGVDDVDIGINVGSYPDPEVWVIFDDVLVNGYVYAYTVGLQYPEQISQSWDIQTDAIFDQAVTVILILDLADFGGSDPTTARLLKTEDELSRADVNLDGRVNGTDVSIVANANPSELGDGTYESSLDLNGDTRIDDEDVNIVNNYVGEFVWQDITLLVDVGTDLVYVYGVTDHFSIFGVHW